MASLPSVAQRADAEAAYCDTDDKQTAINLRFRVLCYVCSFCLAFDQRFGMPLPMRQKGTSARWGRRLQVAEKKPNLKK